MHLDDPALIFTAWSALLTVFGMGISWLVNRIFKMLDDLRKEDELIKRDMRENYVRRDDFHDFKRDVMSILQRIENKLDSKADK